MKYKFHISLMLMAAVLSLVSCSDSYPGLEYTSGNGAGISNDESSSHVPIMVFTNEQNYFQVTATRGTGPFDKDYGLDYWENMYQTGRIYVYAFRCGVGRQADIVGEADLTVSRWAAGDDESDESYGKNCLVDGKGGHGMKMTFTEDQPGYLKYEYDFFNDQDDSKEYGYMRYYGKKYNEVPYNFFAYYLDDAMNDIQPKRETGKIWYEFDIDGSQDIMCGYAPFPKDMNELLQKKGIKDCTDAEKNNILNIGGFSAYAAQRGLNPEVDLKHELVRLEFLAYPGDYGADELQIQKIEVECKRHCEIIVASKNPDEVGTSFTGGYGNVELKEKSDGKSKEEELKPFKLKECNLSYKEWKANAANGKEDNYYRIGSCLMLPEPEVSEDGTYAYKIKLTFGQPKIESYEKDGMGNLKKDEDGNLIPIYVKNDDGTIKLIPVTATYNVKLSNGVNFKKGYKYPITLKVYGFKEITISSNLPTWESGEDIPPIDEIEDMTSDEFDNI